MHIVVEKIMVQNLFFLFVIVLGHCPDTLFVGILFPTVMFSFIVVAVHQIVANSSSLNRPLSSSH